MSAPPPDDPVSAAFLLPGTLHPSHLGRLAPSVGPAALAGIAAHPRFAARFRGLLPPALLEHDAPVPDGPAERLVLLPADRIAACGLLMGAAWHARPIGRCIGSDAVMALEAAIGRDARVFGLRSAALGVAPAETVPAEQLGERVRVAGARCLRRWCVALRPPFRDLAFLRLPRDGILDAAPDEAEPIIDAVLRQVLDAA